MTRIAFSLMIFMLFFAAGCSSEVDAGKDSTAVTQETGKAAEVVWYNFDEGLAKATKENKPALIDFYTDWCHWCKVMDEKTFRSNDVAAKLTKNFIAIRINAEAQDQTVTYKGQKMTNMELTRAFRVSGFPSLGFLDPAGEVITVIPGFIPPETFINILGYIDQECYKKSISFDDYLKKKGDCK
jgi:thioredoxin-related protein